MVEGARLESVYTGNRIASSNLAVSACCPPKLQQRRVFYGMNASTPSSVPWASAKCLRIMAPHVRIQAFRLQKGLTQEQLAELSGISERTIQRIENGETTPRSHSLKAIATALDKTYEDLTGITEASLLPGKNNRHGTQHFLHVLLLSCFSYLVIPWVHFLIPGYLLKRQQGLDDDLIAWGRRIIRQQICWVVVMHLLLFTALAYNLIRVSVFGQRSYLISYLWPFLAMYFVNAAIIVINLFRLREFRGNLPKHDITSGHMC